MEDRKEQFIKELMKAIKRGRDPAKIVAAWEREYVNEFDNEDDLEDYFDEILSEARSGTTHQQPDVGEKEELIKRINKWLRYLKYGSRVKLITYEEIHEIDESRIIPNMSNIRNKNLDDIEEDLFEIQSEIDRLKMTGHKKLQDMFDELEQKLTIQVPNEEELKLLSMTLQDYYKQLGDLDLTLANDREKMYAYWREVADVYTTLVDTIEEFKELVAASRADADVKRLVAQLNIPPPYVKELDKVNPAESRGVNTRILEFIEQMSGAKSPKKTTYETEHQLTGKDYDPLSNPRTKDRKDTPVSVKPMTEENRELTYLSQRQQAESPMVQDSKEKSTSSTWLTEEERNLMEDFDEIEVDPVMAKLIKEDWFTINVGMGDDLEKVLDALDEIYESFSPNSEDRQRVGAVIKEIIDSTKDMGKFFLPLTNWLKDIDPSLIDEVAKTEEETGRFFGLLNRIFLESGTLPISMDVRVGSPESGKFSPRGGGPAQQGKGDKPPHKGLRTSRQQGFEGLEEREDQGFSKKLQSKIKELMKLLNDYYFHPMSKGWFVHNEKPEFITSGESIRDLDDPTEEFDPDDPDITSIEGRFPFKSMDLKFGTHPKAHATNELLTNNNELLKISNLEQLEQYLKDIKSGYELKGWKQYVTKLERTVKLLDKIFPAKAKMNRIWAAGQLGTMLINHQSKSSLSSIKLFDKPVDSLYKKFLELTKEQRNEEGELVGEMTKPIFPIDQIKEVIQTDEYINLLRREEKWAEESDVKKIFDIIKSIVKLTSPKPKGETVSSDLERERSQVKQVKKSLLVAHDAIRKMNNREIYYGSLDINELEDMDYLISKLYMENNVEVNSMEIISIVNSINSHENISKTFGFGEEIIYKIKGLCR